MSLLTGVNHSTQTEANTNRMGGGFTLLDGGVHPLPIELAYMHIANSGARAIKFVFKGESGQLRSDQYFTSGTTKGMKTYYEREVSGKTKQFELPGFTMVNDIFKLAGFNDLNDAVVEEKVINLYNKEAGGEVPTKVQMITNLLEKVIPCGVSKKIVDKTSQGSDGDYHPTGETRETNELEIVFNNDGYTVVELELIADMKSKGQDTSEIEPTFITAWNEKFKGQVINEATGAADTGTAGAPKAAGTPKKLFK